MFGKKYHFMHFISQFFLNVMKKDYICMSFFDYRRF